MQFDIYYTPMIKILTVFQLFQ